MAPSLFSSKNKLDSPGPVQKLFTRDKHNFKYHGLPVISVSAADCGASGQVGNLNSLAGAGTPAELFPTLTWQFEDDEEKDEVRLQKLNRIKEYLLIAEDLDGGTFGSTAQAIGIYYAIPPQKSIITADDIVKAKTGKLERLNISPAADRSLLGGFKYGDLDGKVWRAPKSMHRIHFQVIALARTVDTGSLSHWPTIRSFYGECEGSVLGWGEWVGIYQKK